MQMVEFIPPCNALNDHNLAAAACAAGLHALALADLYGGLAVDGRVAHTLLDLARHGQERLLDVACVLG